MPGDGVSMEHQLLHEGVLCVIKVARDVSGMQWLQSLLTRKEEMAGKL